MPSQSTQGAQWGSEMTPATIGDRFIHRVGLLVVAPPGSPNSVAQGRIKLNGLSGDAQNRTEKGIFPLVLPSTRVKRKTKSG